MVDVGNPELGRSGCCAIYWWWMGQYCSLHALWCRRVCSKVIWMVHCNEAGFLAAGMNSLKQYGWGKMAGSLKSEQKKKRDCLEGWEKSGWQGMLSILLLLFPWLLCKSILLWDDWYRSL